MLPPTDPTDIPLQRPTPDSSDRSSTLSNSTSYFNHGFAAEIQSYSEGADLSTPSDYDISSGRGYAGAWPCSNDAYLSTPTEGSVSIATGTWGGSEDTNMSLLTEGSVSIATGTWGGSEDTDMSLPTDGGYTNHAYTAETWANRDDGNSNAAPAPLSDLLEPWTDANERSPSNSNSGPSWALLEMLREPTLPSASNPFPGRQSLMNELDAESLPEYDVLPQVGYHGQHINSADISGIVGGVTSVGPPVPLNSLLQHSYPLPTAHGPRYNYPLNNWESSTGHGGIPSQAVLSQALTSHPTPRHEPDNPIGSTAMYGPPPPPVPVTPAQPKSPSSGTTSEGQAKKRAVRRGPLNPQQRKDAHRVRLKRACFPCRELKQKCDPVPGDCCRPCLARKQNPKVSRWLIYCDFSPMADRWVLMLPSYIIGHLQDHEMEKYLASAGILPLCNIVRAEWTWGYGPPLVMKMEEISTLLARSSLFHLDADEKSHEHLRGDLVPLWIGEDQCKEVRNQVRRQIRNLVRRPLKGFPEFYHSEMGGSEFQSKLLELICRFHQTSFGKGSSELTRALELFVLCFIMSENLHLTPESRQELGRSMWFWEDNPAERYPTPAIALRQLKQQLLPMLVDWMKAVLTDIHRLCTRHEKSNWTIAFAILILFALICQDLQISAMLGGIWEDENKENERNGLPYDYTDARECIMDMEKEGFGVLVDFFKMGYRKFKPLEGDFSEDAKRGLHKDSLTFIRNVRRLLHAKGKAERNLVREREQEEPIDKIPPRQFAVRNVSRLVLNLLPNPYAQEKSKKSKRPSPV